MTKQVRREALLKVSHIMRKNGKWYAEAYRMSASSRTVVKFTESSAEKFFETLPRLLTDIDKVRGQA